MNKTLKKIFSIVLAVVMMMSFAAVVFAVDGAQDVVKEYNNITEILLDIVMEIWGMIRYIFYDVFLGVPA